MAKTEKEHGYRVIVQKMNYWLALRKLVKMVYQKVEMQNMLQNGCNLVGLVVKAFAPSG